MILYSIIPVEIVFESLNQQDEIKYFETEYLGEKLQVAQMENNRYMITRLISTSPKSYLNPGLQPGSIITNIKIKE